MSTLGKAAAMISRTCRSWAAEAYECSRQTAIDLAPSCTRRPTTVLTWSAFTDVNSWPVASVLALISPRIRRSTRSEEHTSELQSLMRISYAVFCLKKKKTTPKTNTYITHNYYHYCINE